MTAAEPTGTTTDPDAPVQVLGVVGGPEPGGRTATAVAGVLAGAAAAGARTRLLELSTDGIEAALAAFAEADAVVLGSPVFRAGHSALLRELLERTERGKWGERTDPLRGTAAAIVLTGADHHHYLATDGLRGVLAGFFAVQVLSPGLYFQHADFTDRTTLTDGSAALCAAHGSALVDLARAIRSSPALRGITPQA